MAWVGKAGSIPEEIHPATNGSPLGNAIIAVKALRTDPDNWCVVCGGELVDACDLGS